MGMSTALLVTAFALAAPGVGSTDQARGWAPPTSLVGSLSLGGERVFARALPRSLRGPPRVDGGTVVLESILGAVGWAGGASILGAIGLFALDFPGLATLGLIGAVGGMALGVIHTGWRRGYSGKIWATLLVSLLGNALTAGLLYHGYLQDWPGSYVALPLLSAVGSLAGTIGVYHATSGFRGPRRGCIRFWGTCL